MFETENTKEKQKNICCNFLPYALQGSLAASKRIVKGNTIINNTKGKQYTESTKNSVYTNTNNFCSNLLHFVVRTSNYKSVSRLKQLLVPVSFLVEKIRKQEQLLQQRLPH